MVNKKAQAAMEFLMTYGWAILVVLVVIGALAYFGVLSPESLLPEKCFLPIGMECEEHMIKGGVDGLAQFDIRNTMGSNIMVDSMKVIKDETTVCEKIYGATPLAIQNGAAKTIRMPINSGDDDYDAVNSYCLETDLGLIGSKYKYELEIKYHKEGKETYIHTLNGDLLTKVE